MELSDGKSVDFAPLIQVIVDDEFGHVYVEDAVEILDAMIGLASRSFPSSSAEQKQSPSPLQEKWTMEHEICGDLQQLLEGWEQSNQLTTQSLVRLCLQENCPDDNIVSDRTAVRNGATTAAAAKPVGTKKKGITSRKRAKRTVLLV